MLRLTQIEISRARKCTSKSGVSFYITFISRLGFVDLSAKAKVLSHIRLSKFAYLANMLNIFRSLVCESELRLTNPSPFTTLAGPVAHVVRENKHLKMPYALGICVHDPQAGKIAGKHPWATPRPFTTPANYF